MKRAQALVRERGPETQEKLLAHFMKILPGPNGTDLQAQDAMDQGWSLSKTSSGYEWMPPAEPTEASSGAARQGPPEDQDEDAAGGSAEDRLVLMKGGQAPERLP